MMKHIILIALFLLPSFVFADPYVDIDAYYDAQQRQVDAYYEEQIRLLEEQSKKNVEEAERQAEIEKKAVYDELTQFYKDYFGKDYYIFEPYLITSNPNPNTITDNLLNSGLSRAQTLEYIDGIIRPVNAELADQVTFLYTDRSAYKRLNDKDINNAPKKAAEVKTPESASVKIIEPEERAPVLKPAPIEDVEETIEPEPVKEIKIEEKVETPEKPKGVFRRVFSFFTSLFN